ncbi:hypothetical protein OS493_032174 [Desmophyllum pertusum]|uniref:Leucine-rich repeat-containing N-terminal plant-type domain-containing protein n=1 Tax=Desmophyllum pertusum TaxID=174260 RepID=A0A9W9ZXJ5_9CNID|nr:hypothetical protein OS493_032174 [Desmophyllum pertusum]
MWKLILLSVLFQRLSVDSRWPRDTYDYNLFLEMEGHDCLRRIYAEGSEFPIFMYDTSFTPDQEREVLLDIYTSTNGKQWYENSRWNSSTSHCSWYGITCYNNTYIKTIVLAYNDLEGSLPSNLWKIRNLMSLCTPGNPRLRGRIGDVLFGNMSKLLTVVFNGDSITGNIPEDLVKLTRLRNFCVCAMDGEGFTGRLPEDIGNMTELRVLCLGGNNFTGKLPRSITRLQKLWYLDIRNTPGKMHGHLSDLFAIPSLTYLFISGVELVGEMPSMLPENLKNLVLPGNNISGKFPQTFPKINRLEILNVANNQLSGDVPGQMLLLPGIDMIDLSQNKFSSINRGRSWSANASATVKSYFSLAGNRNLALNFTSFMELFSIHIDFVESPSILNLSFCDIKSPVLANLFYLERMSTCDLRGNRFYGAIPDFLEDFSFLTYFDISSNNLSGSLPVGIQNLISLQYLDISGNPSMRKGTSASTNVFCPDFSKMMRPPGGDNFTCPEGRLTFNNGRIRLDPTFYEYRHCICDADFYGEIGLCKKCMDGGTCIQHTVTVPEELRPNIMKMATGYWPSPHPQNATHLVKCPVSSACNPSDSCTCRLDTTPKYTNSTRYRPSVSSLITTCNQSCICHSGNTDRFCSRCKGGFYKIGGLCFRCTKGNLTYYYLFIPIFAVSFLVLLWSYFYFKLRPIKWFAVTAVHFLLMLIFMLLEFLPAWVFKLNLVVFVLCMTSRGKAARSLISITVFYIQTMDFMVSSANVWPQKVVAAQKYLSSYWNLYFPSLSCDLPSLFTPVGKFAFLLLLPVVCMATVGLYFVILFIYNKVRPHEQRMEKVHFKCRQSAFFCLSFSYFPVVKQTLSILRPCHNDRDVLYMPNSPWIECTSHTYNTLTALGVVSVVFYVIGFPLFLICLLFVFFRKRKITSPEDRQKLDAWLGPVYLPYKPKYQPYFEIFMLLRRLFLAIALSMISSSSTLQTFVVWLILMVSAIIHFNLQPYHKLPNYQFDYNNFFEPLVLFVLSMSFMLLRFSALDSSCTGTFVWVVMIVNTCVLVVLVGAIFYLLVFAGKARDNGNLDTGNGECDASAREDESSSRDEDRSHLLPADDLLDNVPIDDAT